MRSTVYPSHDVTSENCKKPCLRWYLLLSAAGVLIPIPYWMFSFYCGGPGGTFRPVWLSPHACELCARCNTRNNEIPYSILQRPICEMSFSVISKKRWQNNCHFNVYFWSLLAFDCVNAMEYAGYSILYNVIIEYYRLIKITKIMHEHSFKLFQKKSGRNTFWTVFYNFVSPVPTGYLPTLNLFSISTWCKLVVSQTLNNCCFSLSFVSFQLFARQYLRWEIFSGN